MTEDTKIECGEGHDHSGEDKKVMDLSQESELPPPNFTTFVLSLSTSALLDLGEMAHPATGKKEKKINMAKHSIDMLDMISEKTDGNLSPDEAELLKNVLADLKLRYCSANG